MFDILTEKVKELGLLSNPDEKLKKHLEKIEKENEWELRI